MKKLLIGILLLTAGSVWAHEVGNGGGSVVCYAPDGVTRTSIELFDYWEMSRYLKATETVDLGDESVSVEKKIDLFAQKLKWIDPSRAERYRQAAAVILSQLDKELRDDLGVSPVDDDRSEIDPPAPPCRKELFAIQIKDPKPGETRFMIRKDLYNDPLTSNTTRAGIILHEIIYRDTIQNGARDSFGARLYHFSVVSNHQGVLSSVQAYERLLRQAQLSYKGSAPYYSKVFQQVVYLDRYCAPASGCHGKLLNPTSIQSERLDLKWSSPPDVEFDADGNILSLSFEPDTFQGKVYVLGEWVEVDAKNRQKNSLTSRLVRIVFDPADGRIVETTLKGVLFVQGRLKAACTDFFSRRETDKTSCQLAEPLKIHLGHGLPATFKKGEVFTWSERYDAPLMGTLDTPAELQIAGTDLTAVFQDYVFLNNNGEIVSGQLATPLVAVILGQTEQLSWILDAHDGKASARVERVFNSPKYGGLPVLNLSVGMYERPFDPLCKSLGFTSVISGEVMDSRTQFIQGQVNFYDLLQGKSVLFTDQEVTEVTRLKCQGMVEFNLQ
ncbi:hypothetical protein K2X30_08710 [bacterium]|jgi:hypothetical protein|nr:hypothetical protein [bacterium]